MSLADLKAADGGALYEHMQDLMEEDEPDEAELRSVAKTVYDEASRVLELLDR